jgi:hypothetical protein
LLCKAEGVIGTVDLDPRRILNMDAQLLRSLVQSLEKVVGLVEVLPLVDDGPLLSG